jgi:hypothetical protein
LDPDGGACRERVVTAGFPKFKYEEAVGFGEWAGVVLKRMMAAGLLPEFCVPEKPI